MSLKEQVNGKKILFVCPEFHHYHISIQQRIQENGGKIHFIPTFKATLLKRFLRNTSAKSVENYYEREFRKIRHLDFDLFFQIKGEDIPYKILQDQVKRSRLSTLYQWDSLKNCNYLHLINLFDQVYTFDRKDAEQHTTTLQYLPLFFEKNDCEHKPVTIDLLMVAGYTPWRYGLTEKIFKVAKANGLSVYIHLYSPLKTLIKLWMKRQGVNLKIIRTRKISSQQYARLLKISSTLLDIPSPLQSGLSIRTIEALGAGKKLVTTNGMILLENFYSPNSVLLIKEDFDFEKLVNFIRKEEWDTKDIPHLELNAWLERLLTPNHKR